MSFTPLRKLFPSIGGPEGPQLARILLSIQDAVDDALRSLQRPIVDGVYLRDVAVSTSAVNVPHGLGRRWNGYIVTRRSASVGVYDGSGTSEPMREINLVATGSATVDLWVF